jgi:hypothetical protein
MNKKLLFTTKQMGLFTSTESKDGKENQFSAANQQIGINKIISASSNQFGEIKEDREIAINLGFNLHYIIIYH